LKPRDIVLVVDDSPGTLGMLTDALEDGGYTVLIAASGADAVALVERISPDIILMDAIMPAMDGFETCRRIKQNHAISAVPVIFMTGLKDTESVVKGLEAGGVDYVTKPVAPDEIMARIRVHLTNARQARSAHIALDTAGRFLLAADETGLVRWCTPHAARLLASKSMADQVVLPLAAIAWLRQQAGLAGDTAPKQVLRLSAPQSGQTGELEFNYIGRAGPGEFLLRLAEAKAPEQASVLKQRLGLTTREAEVLFWLTRGKPNRDIAEILGMSPRTVNKHLEQAYTKLGIENRAAAVALAIRALTEG
jgi:DNA-binding response OmpR family regulator/DNA-binding CsgD family transcriptional regulator